MEWWPTVSAAVTCFHTPVIGCEIAHEFVSFADGVVFWKCATAFSALDGTL